MHIWGRAPIYAQTTNSRRKHQINLQSLEDEEIQGEKASTEEITFRNPIECGVSEVFKNGFQLDKPKDMWDNFTGENPALSTLLSLSLSLSLSLFLSDIFQNRFKWIYVGG